VIAPDGDQLFDVVEGPHPIGVGTYSIDLRYIDYKLDVPPPPAKPAFLARVEAAVGIRPPVPMFVLASTLTLVFNRHNQLLESLDAYIGLGLSRKGTVLIPEVRRVGQGSRLLPDRVNPGCWPARR
jgi:hypothetical protein